MRRYTVPALAAELDDLVLSRYPAILVEGEVGQVQLAPSGHCYLELRDRGGPRNQDCTLKAIVWKDDWNRLRYRPNQGDRVLARGRLGVFTPRTSLQLQVFDIAPAGQGDLAKEIEARKARLMADGLFDARRKRPLPVAPRFVGVATSLKGAALQDFLKVSLHRWPAARILVAACVVQGPEAPSSVIRGIDLLIEDGRSQVIVVTRGGGSKEDLLAFHDETLARAIAASPVPVVSAVGHQIDTTIADLVADAVAPTPSAAAMLVLPDGPTYARRIDEAAAGLHQAMKVLLRRNRERVESRRARLRHPGDRLRDHARRLADLEGRLSGALGRRFQVHTRRLDALEGRLRALSPLAVLERGYAIVHAPRGLLTDPAQVSGGDPLTIRVHGGTVDARVVAGPDPDGTQLRLL